MPVDKPYSWPRPYIFQLFKAAVDAGMIYVEGLDEVQAKSLSMALLRSKRRVDTKHTQTFMAPEYFLVTVGAYDAESRRLPIIYTKTDFDLPSFRPATYDEQQQQSIMPEPQPVIPITLETSEGAAPLVIDDFVQSLVNKAKKHDN